MRQPRRRALNAKPRGWKRRRSKPIKRSKSNIPGHARRAAKAAAKASMAEDEAQVGRALTVIMTSITSLPTQTRPPFVRCDPFFAATVRKLRRAFPIAKHYE
jgi:hypothetical protein